MNFWGGGGYSPLAPTLVAPLDLILQSLTLTHFHFTYFKIYAIILQTAKLTLSFSDFKNKWPSCAKFKLIVLTLNLISSFSKFMVLSSLIFPSSKQSQFCRLKSWLSRVELTTDCLLKLPTVCFVWFKIHFFILQFSKLTSPFCTFWYWAFYFMDFEIDFILRFSKSTHLFFNVQRWFLILQISKLIPLCKFQNRPAHFEIFKTGLSVCAIWYWHLVDFKIDPISLQGLQLTSYCSC